MPPRPNPILRIADSDGKVLYDLTEDREALEPYPAVDPRVAYIVTDILSDNDARTPAFGSTSPLNVGVPAAAKTGTTNDYRDNWTLGFTREVTVGVWVGNHDRSPLRSSSGVTGAAPTGSQADWLRVPDGLERRPVCALSGLEAAPACPRIQSEWLPAEGRRPACSWHRELEGRSVKMLCEFAPDASQFDRKQHQVH